MKLSKRRWQLSLLVKELTELAARKRTYQLRFVYASLLFALSCVVFYGNNSIDQSANVPGTGRPMFLQLVWLQFAAIYLLLPATICGVISSEKERDSLGVLLLTALTPWQIISQKLFGRLIPMLSFLFISFPLMAIAFSHGGVTLGHLIVGIILLALSCMQVGALGIACSAFFRTTNEAFAASYILLIVVSWVLPELTGPVLFGSVTYQTGSDIFMSAARMLISIAMLLIAARVFLESRAFVPPTNHLLRLFQSVDQFFSQINFLTGGIVLAEDHECLPKRSPVSWRETSKKSMGTVRYLFRILVALEVPLLCVFQLETGSVQRSDLYGLSILLFLLWGLAAVLIAIHAAGVVSSERSSQTLNVLLTTPIPGRQIIQQKSHGVRRLVCVLWVPFLSIYAFEWWFKSNRGWEYFAWSTACTFVYLPLVGWFALWLGLRMRTQVRAIALTLCLLASWLIVPPAVQYILAYGLAWNTTSWETVLPALNPIAMIQNIEWGNPASYRPSLLINILVHTALLVVFRRSTLLDSDVRLGRPVRRFLPQQQELQSEPSVS